MKNVTLRIVGLFFNKKVKIEDTVNTVKGVMDAYINAGNDNLAKAGGLAYMVEANLYKKENSLKEVSFNYDGKYDIDLDKPGLENGGKTLGEKKLDAGVRTLTEMRVNENVILAWQYYVEDKNGKNKSATKEAGGFTPFGQKTNTYTIEEDDNIIWRLVAITLAEKKEYTAQSKK